MPTDRRAVDPLPRRHGAARALAAAWLLLSVGVTSTAGDGVTEHHCIHDEMMSQQLQGKTLGEAMAAGRFMASAVLEVPRAINGAAAGDGYSPIRIAVYTEDVYNSARYCTAAGDSRPNFTGSLIVCTAEDILTAEKQRLLTENMIPAAVKMHSDRLSVQPLAHITVAGDDMSGNICGSFTVPADVLSNGVMGADFVLFVAAGPIAGNTVAWATTCAVLESNRPVVGVINMSPKFIDGSDQSIRTMAHEMMHALGFSRYFFEELGMVRIATDIRGKLDVPVLAGRNIIQRTGNQYGCDTIVGAEVDDSGGAGTYGSHWHFRNAKDEMMCGYVGPAMKYSAISIAAMEDLGFYKGNYTNAEHMAWGFQAGCVMLDSKCLVAEKSRVPSVFCDQVNVTGCTVDRMSVGTCMVRRHTTEIPAAMRYFSDPALGGYFQPDYCPLYYQSPRTLCSSGDPKQMPGSRIGDTSRCVDAADGSQLSQSICADIECDAVSKTFVVRFLGSESWVDCPVGDTVDASSSAPTQFVPGSSILCPPYNTVCPETFASLALNVLWNTTNLAPEDGSGGSREDSGGNSGDGAYHSAPRITTAAVVALAILLSTLAV